MDRRGVKGRRVNLTMQRARAAQERVRAQRIAWAPALQASPGELKFTDLGPTTSTLTSASAAWTTPGATFLLNGLVPNSTATGRIGRKVVMKSLLLRAELRLATTSTQGGYGRYLVIYDRQANGAFPTGGVTDILLFDGMQSPMNLSNKDRFMIVAEGYFDRVSTQGDYVTSGVEVYKKLNLPVQFNSGTAGTIADIATGSLFVMFAQNATIGTAAPSVVWTTRVRYTDN